MNAMESAVSHSWCVRLPVSVRCRMTPSRSIFGISRDGMVNSMTTPLSSCERVCFQTCRPGGLLNIITEIGRAQYPGVGKWSPTEEGKLVRMTERAAKLSVQRDNRNARARRGADVRAWHESEVDGRSAPTSAFRGKPGDRQGV